MTVSVNKVMESYSADGSTTVFSVPFLFLEQTHLKVYVDDVLKTLNVDYTVQGEGTDSGGVTFSSAPASGATVKIIRDTDMLQDKDYIAYGKFPAEANEEALDKLTLQVQEHNWKRDSADEDLQNQITSNDEELSRSLKYPEGETTDPLLPALANRKGKVLAFDPSDGSPMLVNNPINVGDYTGIIAGNYTELRMIDTSNLEKGTQASVASREVLADGGQGMFVWDTTDHSSTGTGNVDADTQSGIYVAPNSDLSGASGAWVRQYSGAVNVRWFGAVGDGESDDAVAIDETSKFVFDSGGGTVFIPEGVYLLGTTSTYTSNPYYILARDGVSFIGEGQDVTTLKVKAGENARFKGTTGPFIIATHQSTPLKNVTVSDITFDWDGQNNLLGEPGVDGETARNNASVFSYNGGINIIVERITVKETPGNQCVFFPATSNQGQRNITVRNSNFIDSGDGLPNNYNDDHSSVYCNGDELLYENNYFTAVEKVDGAAYEIHGSHSRARNNRSYNYGKGFWIATNYEDLDDIRVEGDVHKNVVAAFAVVSQTWEFGSVSVSDSKFVQRAGLPDTGTPFFINGNTIEYCETLDIRNCQFIGQGYSNHRLMQHFKIENLIFEGNKISGFGAYGIASGGLDLGDGRVVGTLRVNNNDWNDVESPLYFSAPSLIADSVMIRGNDFDRSATDSRAVMTLSFSSSDGLIAGNRYSPNFTTRLAGTQNGIDFHEVGSGAYTPVVSGASTAGTATYTKQLGRYTVSGSLCTVAVEVEFSGHTGTGAVQISLPFQAASDGITAVGSVAFSNYTFFNLPVPRVSSGADQIQIFNVLSDAAYSLASLYDAGTILVTISYEIERQ